MGKSEITSSIKKLLLEKLALRKAKTVRRIKSFQLGYRWGLVTAYDKQMLGNLIEEILKHANDPVMVKSFLEGERHARHEKPLVKKSLEHEETHRKKEAERIEQEKLEKEISQLQKNREEKQQQKDQSKSR
ncbi:hypothetical protein [Tenacibaculum agarivorans]|uniref:hypothetical protein n=1 Tax=Tenacibaculum agarivorans TaxID=1908389 RepID=UPI00094BAFA5|nr:hypothetical protein [Tenacibaculum agarivorans]